MLYTRLCAVQIRWW